MVMLMKLLRKVFRQSSYIIETSRQYSLTASLCYWKVETTKCTKIGTNICTLKLVYEASQEIVENSVYIFKELRCGVLLQLARSICLARTVSEDIENLIKIDWNCSEVESFVGDCLFTDIISNTGKSLHVALICLHVTFDNFSRWAFLIFLILANF